MESSLCVSQAWRKLGLGETSGVHVFVKSGLPLEDSTWVFLGIEDTDRFMEFSHHNPDGFQQVGIATDHHSAIEEVQMRVVEQVGGKVHIGAFFLGFDDFDGSGAAGNWIGKRHLDGFREKMPVVDLAIRTGAQSAEVERLTERLVRITRSRIHLRRVVLDPDNLVLSSEVKGGGFGDVEPLECGAAERAEVEVETIHINDRPHAAASIKKHGLALAHQPKTASPRLQRGFTGRNLAEEPLAVKRDLRSSARNSFRIFSRFFMDQFSFLRIARFIFPERDCFFRESAFRLATSPYFSQECNFEWGRMSRSHCSHSSSSISSRLR